jgi:hypothetical protein
MLHAGIEVVDVIDNTEHLHRFGSEEIEFSGHGERDPSWA